MIEQHLGRIVQADLTAEQFRYDIDETALAAAERLDGKLLLVTSLQDLPAEEILARYRARADIERGFRVLKSEIEIAPVYHRLPERIRAHALICFIALVLHRVLRLRLKAAGSACSPKRLVRSLRHSVRIAGRTYQGITRPTPEQRELLEEVGIAPPKNPA